MMESRNVHARVTEHNPDLVVIGFGMNIPSKDSSIAKYEESIRNMIKDVRAKNPNAEFHPCFYHTSQSGLQWLDIITAGLQDSIGKYCKGYYRRCSCTNDRYSSVSLNQKTI